MTRLSKGCDMTNQKRIWRCGGGAEVRVTSADIAQINIDHGGMQKTPPKYTSQICFLPEQLDVVVAVWHFSGHFSERFSTSSATNALWGLLESSGHAVPWLTSPLLTN